MHLIFITFRFIDAIDILLVAFLLYELYNLVKGTTAINILTGMVLLYVIWLIVKALNMTLFSSILGGFINAGIIAIIIVFQQELRRFLLLIGKTDFLNRRNFAKNFLMLQTNDKRLLDVHPLIKACRNMSEKKTGALIVIAHDTDLSFYSQTGDIIDSNITEAILESIFYKNSPLHDGAIIIDNNKIHAVRCVLPSTEKNDFPVHLGMRHRAAVGITEKSDAIAIVVSEQTGSISLAHGGELEYDLTPERLANLIQEKSG
ncbi:MAG TPA: diadenylate cyclase CdaA [Bacteroidia bacterium]|nr:diadenylate cyclase CdaA [Bacteroidia bacterium]